MAYTVAITGNAASGKSAVGAVWREMGVPVVDADRLSRDAVAPGTPGLDAVRLAFGDGVIAADGGLDRARMREVAFGDSGARARLEGIVHPIVLRKLDEWMGQRAEAGEGLVACEVPLLFELGMRGRFDRVVLVDAHPGERHRRMVEQRNLTDVDAGGIMRAQGDPNTKRNLSDAVIHNDGTRAELRRAALRTLAETRHAAGLPLRVDLHIHTWDSFDSLSDPDAVIDRAIERGIDRIAITDHDRLRAALRLADLHPSLVIPGEEVKTAEGVDVIGLYLCDEIPGGIGAADAISRIRDQGGLAYLPHPYAPGKSGGGRMAEELGTLCDVIEVFNARIHQQGRQDAAGQLCRRLGKVGGAGSDAHTLGEVGGAWAETLPHESVPGALLQALATGLARGRMASRLVHFGSTWAKVRKAWGGGPWTDRPVARGIGVAVGDAEGADGSRPLTEGVVR